MKRRRRSDGTRRGNKPSLHRAQRLAIVLSLAVLASSSAALALHAARLEARFAGEQGRATETTARLEKLEARSSAARRVVAEAAPSVVFVQGAYRFLEGTTGRPLRYVGVGPDGEPMRTPSGEPFITLDGNGPIVERLFTGSGFVVSDDGWLLTNRHVAEPWKDDGTAEALRQHGLIPVLERLVGYLANVDEPFTLTLVAASHEVDLAILRGVPRGRVKPLTLGTAVPAPGDDVVVLGYPTGLRALVARASAALESEFAGSDGDGAGFWTVARRLSEEGAISPLATRGIVGQVGPSAILYDAETTSGGSGGPVLALSGEVIAVNTAILPEFGGANLGVPAERVRALLELAHNSVAPSGRSD